jgi:hypothetical protein
MRRLNKTLKRLEKRFTKMAFKWEKAQDWEDTPFEGAGINDTLKQLYLELAHEMKRARRRLNAKP